MPIIMIIVMIVKIVIITMIIMIRITIIITIMVVLVIVIRIIMMIILVIMILIIKCEARGEESKDHFQVRAVRAMRRGPDHPEGKTYLGDFWTSLKTKQVLTLSLVKLIEK